MEPALTSWKMTLDCSDNLDFSLTKEPATEPLSSSDLKVPSKSKPHTHHVLGSLRGEISLGLA